MEQVVSKNAPYSRYGSDILKQAYIYGALDMSPTILTRSLGFGWNIGGWLLFSFLQKASNETAERTRKRVREGLPTTFASHSTIGRATCRERVCHDVEILGVTVSLNTKPTHNF